MRLAFRLALFLAQCLAFLSVAGISAKLSSYVMAETYQRGDVPRGHFPVVAWLPRGADSPPADYQLVRWSDIEETRRRYPQAIFHLPQTEGRFALPRQGDFAPHVRFRVLESTGSGQLIEVVWNDDDYEVYGKYLADGSSLRPLYFRIWGAGNMLVGLVPGLVAAWLLGWVMRRKLAHGPDAPAQAAGAQETLQR